EQPEIADDKVGGNRSNRPNEHVAENTKSAATECTADEAGGDSARNDLQRQVAKGHRKCSEYHNARSSFWLGAAHGDARIRSNSGGGCVVAAARCTRTQCAAMLMAVHHSVHEAAEARRLLPGRRG